MRARRGRWFDPVLMLCLGTVSCMAVFGSYGRFVPSTEVTNELEGYQVNPDYRYYVSGPHLNPNALMGLDRRYRLDPSTLWREVDMSPPKMQEIVEGMKTKVSELQTVLNGFKLTDEKGRQVGIWYSILKARTFLRMNDDGTVRIDTPPLDTYESHEGDSRRLGPMILHRY